MKLKLIQTKQVYSLYRSDTGCFIGFIPRGIACLEDIQIKFQPWFRQQKDNKGLLLRGTAQHSWPRNFLNLTTFCSFPIQALYRECLSLADRGSANSMKDWTPLHLLLQKWAENDLRRCRVASHPNPSGWISRCGRGPATKAHIAGWGR